MCPSVHDVANHHGPVLHFAVQLRARIDALKLAQPFLIALNVVMTVVATGLKACADRNALSIFDKAGMNIFALLNTAEVIIPNHPGL